MTNRTIPLIASILAAFVALTGFAWAATPAPETPVLIKPVEQASPDALDYQGQVDRVVGASVSNLLHLNGVIVERQREITACHADHVKAGDGSPVSEAKYSECLAKPTAEMKSFWDEAAITFKEFSTGLKSLAEQAAKVQTFIAEQGREDADKLRGLESKIKAAASTLARAQEMRKSGRTLSPAEQRTLLVLMDDVLTSKANADRIARRNEAHEQKLKVHALKKVWLAELSADSEVLEHKSLNRGEIWAGTLEDLRRRGAVSAFDGAMVRLGQGLAGSAKTFSEFGQMFDKLPAPPESPDVAEVDDPSILQPRLLNGNFDDDLTAVLGSLAKYRSEVTQ